MHRSVHAASLAILMSLVHEGCAQLAGIEDWTPLAGERACEAGAHKCDEASLLACNTDRTGWVVTDTCVSADHCDTDAGECDICVAGSWRCDAATLQQCDDRGEAYVNVRTCKAAAHCDAEQGICGPTSGNLSQPWGRVQVGRTF
ncbi:MAG: hypothetical protein MUF54_15980 [Polyangiaceae bacterium]|jgi:hypothetical protein|nr:hypothetical protein [Polyangiaceae bacterium]